MEKYLPLQYCEDILGSKSPYSSQPPDGLERLFESFSNRDFGSYPYVFAHQRDSKLAEIKVANSQKPRKVELTLQTSEIPLVLELWSRSKQVYEPDSTFTEVLLHTNSIRVFPSLLRRIPFKDFYIDLSKNENFKSEGIFVCARVYDNDEIRILYMVADNKKRIKFVDILDFTPKEHPMEDIEKEAVMTKEQRMVFDTNKSIIQARCGVLEDKRICTGKDYVVKPFDSSYYKFDKSKCPSVYQGHNYCYIEISNISPEDPISNISMFIIQFLNYISSSKPNISESESTKHTYRPFLQPKNKYSQVRKWDVEKYYGDRIRVLEEKAKSSGEYKGGNHRSPRPHTRCAHYQYYWCGHGEKKHLEQRWIDVIYVNGTYKDIVVRENETTL